MNIGACHPRRCLPLVVVNLALLSRHVVTSQQDWLLRAILPPEYDAQRVPLEQDDDLLTVQGTIHLKHFDVGDDQRSLHTDLILCLHWRDYRLREAAGVEEFQVRSKHQIDRFWTPPVFFRNALSVKRLVTLQSNEYIIVSLKQKSLRYCSRLKVHFECIFRLSNFPFDSQKCHFELQSSIKHLPNIVLNLQIVSAEKATSQFKLQSFWNGSCESTRNDHRQPFKSSSPGNCAFVAFRLVRFVSIYVIRFYLPTLLIVMVCYVQFWICHEEWPDRVMFNVDLMLVLLDVSDDSFEDVNAPYVVSLFVWLGFMQFFVYMALLEFILSQVWVRHQIDKKRALQMGNTTESVQGKGHSCSRCLTKLLHKLVGPLDFSGNMHSRNMVDYCARFLYPLILLLFISLYVLSTVPEYFSQ